MKNTFKIWSRWDWEHWQSGRQINKWSDKNIVTNQGLNYLLDEFFDSGVQITDWRLAVFEDDYTPLITDTYAAPGYTEVQTLQETTRPQWQPAAAAGKSMSNISNKASFTFVIGKTIYGGAMVGGGSAIDTIGDISGGGILFCASKFTNGSQGFIANDVAKLTVTLSAASG